MNWRPNGFYRVQLRLGDLMARVGRIRRIRKWADQHLPKEQP